MTTTRESSDSNFVLTLEEIGNLAAEEGNEKPVEMGHLVQAAKLEAQKIERPLSEAEIRGWL